MQATRPSRTWRRRLHWSSPDWNRYYGGYRIRRLQLGRVVLWHDERLCDAREPLRRPDRRPRGACGCVWWTCVIRKPHAKTLLLRERPGVLDPAATAIAILTTTSTWQHDRNGASSSWDAFDVSDPIAPSRAGSDQSAGALVQYDRASGRAITSQLHRVSAGQLTYTQCYERFANAQFEYPNSTPSNGEPVGLCTGFEQSLHLVALSETGAVLEDSLRLSAKERVSSFAAGDGVLFAALGRGGYYGGRYPGGDVVIDCAGPCGGVQRQAAASLELLVLGGFGSGELEVGRLTVESESETPWLRLLGSFTGTRTGTSVAPERQQPRESWTASLPSEPRWSERCRWLARCTCRPISEMVRPLALGQQGCSG